MKNGFYFILIVFISIHFVKAQVGIGTDTPSNSSILDVESTEKGVLLPRMTSAQRSAIPGPANGLTVFDTDLQAYYFYNENESSWESLSSARLERDNYVLVKSEEDLPSPTGGSITLDSNTFYAINGIITLSHPIDINNAYISGFDSFQDGFFKSSGSIFEGNTGGSIRFLSMSGGGKAFNISGGSSLIIQNCVFSDFSKVGDLSNLGLVFFSITQYLNNSSGFTFTDITNLLISNSGWQANNTGILEKFEGTFNLIQKNSGFSIANSGVVAIDVSSNPTVEDAVISGTVFSGPSTIKIDGYTNTTTNSKFNESWFVQAPGIQDDYDDIATGNVYYDGELTSGFSQSVINNNPFKLSGTSVSSNLLRFLAPEDNRLTYNGKGTRTFRINASLSVRGGAIDNIFYSFFIRKNGTTTLTETNSVFYVNGFQNVSSVSLTGTVTLNPGDFIEIWCQRLADVGAGTSQLIVFSQNLTID